MKQYALVIILAVLFSACSAPVENGSSASSAGSPAPANNNAAQANSNASSQPNIAQNGTPTPTPGQATPTVQQIPTPAPDKSAVQPNANSAPAAAAPNGRAPKLVLPQAKIDFGHQSQGKTLVRAIAIRNGGKGNLNIDSVVPS